jgi:D-glycero-D-manno-heptose 1,7-bisphosphate phosphatase
MSSPASRAVFLDRDGVLNETFVRDGVAYPPANINETRILPGVKEAVALLKQLGFLLIVVTNQPDVARGAQTLAGVEAINQILKDQLPLDEFRICPHDNHHNCLCRKPKPGLLCAAAESHKIDLSASFMIGDRAGDCLAGAAAGCKTILIERSYSNADTCRPDFKAADLLEASAIIAKLVDSATPSR